MDSFIKLVVSTAGIWVTNAVAIALIPPFSIMRYALLPIPLLVTYSAALEGPKFESMVMSTLSNSFAVVGALQFIEVVLVNQWSFEYQGPATSRGGLAPMPPSQAESKALSRASSWERFKWGLWSTRDPRYAGTRYPAKNLPQFSYSDPHYVPSRASFLAWKLTESFGIFALMEWGQSYQDVDAVRKDLDLSKIPFFSRIHEVTTEEVLKRHLLAFQTWVAGYLFIRAAMSGHAFLTTLVGWTSPKDFPPLFGRRREWYSLRQFWGVFWHQQLRRVMSSPSHFVTYEVLGLKRGGLVARYLLVFLTFTISGLMHVLVDHANRVPLHVTGAWVVFPLQTLGIMIEDAAQHVFKKVFGPPHGLGLTVAKIMGFLWSLAFFAWSLPVMMYPTTIYGLGRPLLPISLIGIFKS